MILPPLFGTSIKSEDNSWETTRITYSFIDLLSYNKAEPLINISFYTADIMQYDSRIDPGIKITYSVLDIMCYSSG
jgi:hypothetical protein